MAFRIIRNNIAEVQADAIVNTANPKPKIGAGTDQAIHLGAGPELLDARKEIGELAPGEVAVTPAFNLNAKYVIHAVGPTWQGGDQGEAALLRETYEHAIAAALSHECRSVAFPLMAAGTYQFPIEEALKVAMDAFTSCILSGHDLDIILVVLDKQVFDLADKLQPGLQSYIDEKYAESMQEQEYSNPGCASSFAELEARLPKCSISGTRLSPSVRKDDLKHVISQTGESFREALTRFRKEKGMTEPEVYTRAGISRQQFSQKIRWQEDYLPTKRVALKLALALELDYDDAQYLLATAGYTLSKSRKEDLAVSYLLESHIFNLTKVDIELYEAGLPPLSSPRP